MPSMTELRERFSEVFPGVQANTLVDAFTDAFAAQERVAKEMSDIRREVHRLAQAQEQLAQAQARTEQRVEQLAQAQERLALGQERLALAQAKTEKAVQNLARQVGGRSDKMGGSLEDLAIETVPAVLSEEWGVTDIDCSRDVFRVDGEEEEVDLVLRGKLPDGSPLVVLGEVKARLTAREVEAFLTKARRIRPVLGEPEVRVLFFGFQVYLEAREAIKRSGAFMLFSNGRFLKTHMIQRT